LQQEEADEITLKVKIQFKFSYGWLQAFEEWWNVTRQIMRGECATADDSTVNWHKNMTHVITLHAPKDVLTKTKLHWLKCSTEDGTGFKTDKSALDGKGVGIEWQFCCVVLRTALKVWSLKSKLKFEELLPEKLKVLS
jgi:hypothetical protein